MKLFIFSFLLFLAGCSVNTAMLVAPANVGPKETAVQMTEGTSRGFYVLFFGPFGDNSLNAAVNDALSKVKAHTLLNVFVDKTFMSALVFSMVSTHVHGTAITYNELEKTPK